MDLVSPLPPSRRIMEDILYVAVGEIVKENKSILLWALQNSGGKKICITHVHQPAQMIPFMGTRWPASKLQEQEVRAYREIERQKMYNILDEYVLICRQMGVKTETLHTEMDCIEKGIVELISQHGIRKLVMGAAADKRYARKMIELKSKKAVYVRQQAPASCHIQFICKGHLIHTREGSLHGAVVEAASALLKASANIENGQSNHLRSQSVTMGQSNRLDLNCDSVGISDDGISLSRSTSQASSYSACSSSGVGILALGPLLSIEGSENGSEFNATPLSKENIHHLSHPSVLDGKIDDTFYAQIEQAMAEAENARRQAFQESERRGKAVKDTIEAMRRAKVSENLYTEELKQRKEFEEALAKEKGEREKTKEERDEVMEELRIALDQKSLLESQNAESDEMVKGLELRIISAVELLQNYKKERDDFQVERDNALKEAEELRREQGEALGTHMPQFFSEFLFSEIEEATRNFDWALKIGEGKYGSIYKGLLRHTKVVIKMLNNHSLQGPSGLQREVDILSKLKHPNLVTLIGSCQKPQALIYEYLPNGSLEDRISCKNNTAPLAWQTRIRIATELCSALIFLHSSKPVGILHGNLTLANALLDANSVSKLCDFGICNLVAHDQSSSNTTLRWSRRTDPRSTFLYMDPEFFLTGELTLKSDVFSFGIMLLQLLTGRPPFGIGKEVQYALDAGKLEALLDPLAGDWPFEQAKQLVHLALKCCALDRNSRPDLGPDVWTVLEPMRDSCGSSSSIWLGSEENCEPPSYLLCPISHEIMHDPHVAADGFTYEAEALREWLGSGHNTSPMTNLKLEHCNLVPNHALRSAIQEWRQQH